MLENDGEKTMSSETNPMEKRRVVQREKREVRVSGYKKREVITTQDNQERVAVSGFIAQEKLTGGYQNPFELSSLNGDNGFQINAAIYGGCSGRSVSGAGDVNGDGIDDIIIGAPSYNSEVSKMGQSYVVFGQPRFTTPLELSTLNGVNGFQINGIAANGELGSSVSGVGDVNGDGFDDVIIGANFPFPYASQTGQSYVVFGQSRFTTPLELSTLNGVNGFQINGFAVQDRLGHSLSGAGDVNKDGYADIIIGAYAASPEGRQNAGESYVVFGRSRFSKTFELSQLNGANGFQINGIASGSLSGWSVSGAGDVNKDGYADMIIGALDASPNGRTQAGESYVVFGQASFNKTFELSALNGANGFQINGVASGDESGYSVSGAGDVNKDGYADIIIGASYASPTSPSYRKHAGESFVVFGRANFNNTFELSELNGINGFQMNGIAEYDYSGKAVSGAGDVNKDGYADLIIGAGSASPSDSRYGAGESYVVFGQPCFNKTLELSGLNGGNGFQINGIASGNASGSAASGAGDVNGDGIGDIIIGAPSAPNSYSFTGESYVVFGGGSMVSTTRPSQSVAPSLSLAPSSSPDSNLNPIPLSTPLFINRDIDLPTLTQNEQSVLNSAPEGVTGVYPQGKQYASSFWKTRTVVSDNTQKPALSAKGESRLKELNTIQGTLDKLTTISNLGFQEDSASLKKALHFYQEKVTNWQTNVNALNAQDMRDLREDVMKLESRVYGTKYVASVETRTPSKRAVGFFEPKHIIGGVQAPMLGAQGAPLPLMP